VNLLAIDASTYDGSIAVVCDGVVRADVSVQMRGAESQGVMPAIDRALEEAGIAVRAIDRLICGSGPGSFTSLRIAASVAKGLALGLNRPLFSMSSLGLLVGAASVPGGQYVATLDALRSEWYAGLYERRDDGQVLELEPPRLADRASVELLARRFNARMLGPITIDSAERPRASAVGALREWMATATPVDPSTWEPTYGRLAEAQVKWEAAHGRALECG
jgi:tRNA threonylcarbamoyladenosine biosynthesis protein TsaB